MLKLPLSFDKNEWFVIVSLFFLLIGFISVPKIMPRGLTVTVLLYFAILGFTADLIIGAGYVADFYNIMDSSKLELFDVFIYFINYPIYGYFFAYLIYKYEMRKKLLFFLIPAWSGLTVLLEALSVKFNVFTYLNGWNIGFSALAYLFIFSLSASVAKGLNRLWDGRGLQEQRSDHPAQNSR